MAINSIKYSKIGVAWLLVDFYDSDRHLVCVSNGFIKRSEYIMLCVINYEFEELLQMYNIIAL